MKLGDGTREALTVYNKVMEGIDIYEAVMRLTDGEIPPPMKNAFINYERLAAWNLWLMLKQPILFVCFFFGHREQNRDAQLRFHKVHPKTGLQLSAHKTPIRVPFCGRCQNMLPCKLTVAVPLKTGDYSARYEVNGVDLVEAGG